MQNSKRKNKRFTKFLLLLIIAILGGATYQYRYSLYDTLMMRSEDAFDHYIIAAAKKHNVDPMLIKAVISQETRFNPNARGKAGEIGLMQIIRDKSVTDWARYNKVAVPHAGILLKPEVNIDIGTWYLKQGLRRWRKYKHYRELALCQYNAGGSWAEKWVPDKIDEPIIGRISISSTKEYVRSIMQKYYNYADVRAQQHKKEHNEQ